VIERAYTFILGLKWPMLCLFKLHSQIGGR
jgi:hypothetical protein